MGQTGLRDGANFQGVRDHGVATKKVPELNETKAETIACLQRRSR